MVSIINRLLNVKEEVGFKHQFIQLKMCKNSNFANQLSLWCFLGKLNRKIAIKLIEVNTLRKTEPGVIIGKVSWLVAPPPLTVLAAISV